MEIKEIKVIEPKSDKSIVELLRGYLDKSFSEKITFLEICTTINGKYESISISCGKIK
ncbi:MAG: hypothetical protein ACUZ8H_05505 [Candidatus Anammoxibacter sp.]